MHPVTKTKFGNNGILVRYYNTTTSALANGYIVKQTGTNRYVVSDGVHPTQICTLAQTSGQVSSLGSGEPTLCTILISPSTGTGTGATFSATYGLDATSTVSSGGSGFSVGDTMAVTGGSRPTGSFTIATNPNSGDTLTVGGTAITFETSGATGNQVNIGASATLTATALYTFLTGSADTNISKCNYVQAGTTITAISKTSGTTNNALTLATTSGGRITVSAATLTGGVADVGTGTPTVTVASLTGNAAKTVTITTPGTFTTFPTNPVKAYYNGNGRMPATLTLKYKLVSMTASGGTGYTTGETVNFNGLVAAGQPNASITASAGAAASVTVNVQGSGITTKASSFGTNGPSQHVRALYDTSAETVEGNRLLWSTNTSVNGSSVIGSFS